MRKSTKIFRKSNHFTLFFFAFLRKKRCRAISRQKKQANTNDGDERTNDGLPRNLLMEKPIGGQNDDDGRHGHECGGYACSSILYGHE